jgi:thymidylate synthase
MEEQFNLIVVVTKNYAIRYENKVPWQSVEYSSYFENLVKGGVVIMGRKTFENLPYDKRPFQGCLNVVLSTEYPKYKYLNRDELVFTNVYGLQNVIVPQNTGKSFWVIGGLEVYKSLSNHCSRVFITWLDKSAAPNEPKMVDLMPNLELFNYSALKWSDDEQCNYRLLEYKRNFQSSNNNHERQYLQLLRELLTYGNDRDDRTGVGTIGMFGKQLRYDVSKYLPILTTKFVPIGVIIKELLWFLRGETDAKILQRQGVHIWDGNTSREFLDSRGLTHLEEGDIGAGYGHQWRHFNGEYNGCDKDYTGVGFDQIEYVVNELKTNPFSRRIYFSAWNPSMMNQMALPPCHIGAQFYAEKGKDGNMYLSLQFYQRSQDVFLAANFNLVSYTILLYIISKKVNMIPKEVIHVIGDAHIYKNHKEQCLLQLERNPLPQPVLVVNESVKDKRWEDIVPEDFELIGYHYHPVIKAQMAV